MSPTLLELLVAVLLVWVAWKISVWLAPRVFGRRDARPSAEPPRWPPEKNVTPRARDAKNSQSPHANIPDVRK